jgi:hypothetical protein
MSGKVASCTDAAGLTARRKSSAACLLVPNLARRAYLFCSACANCDPRIAAIKARFRKPLAHTHSRLVVTPSRKSG